MAVKKIARAAFMGAHLLQVPGAPVLCGLVLPNPYSIEWISFGASMQNFVRNILRETLWNEDGEVKLEGLEVT